MKTAQSPRIIFDVNDASNAAILYLLDSVTCTRHRDAVLAKLFEDTLMGRVGTIDCLNSLEKDVLRITPTNIILQKIYHKQAKFDNGKTRREYRRQEMVREKDRWVRKASCLILSMDKLHFRDVLSDYGLCLTTAKQFGKEFEHSYDVFTKPLVAYESVLSTLVGKDAPAAECYQLRDLFYIAGQHNRKDMLKFVMDSAKSSKDSYTRKMFECLDDIRF